VVKIQTHLENFLSFSHIWWQRFIEVS